MGYPVLQSSAVVPLMFLMVDSTDHTSAKTGLSPTVTLSKNGGSFASPTGAVTEVANGWYKVAANATDSNTLGPLVLHATGTAADVTDDTFPVVAYDPYTAPVAAPANWASMSIDGSGRVDVIKVAGTSQTARDLGASVLLSNGTGTGQVSLSSGTITVGTNNDKTGYVLSATGSAALTEGYAADGAAATLPQLLYQIWSRLAESSVSSTTLTAKKLDGSTTAMTFTLGDATNPTSITRAS